MSYFDVMLQPTILCVLGQFLPMTPLRSHKADRGSLHIGYLSPTAIVRELRHALRARMCLRVCKCASEGTLCGSGRVRIELRSRKGERSKGKSKERSKSAGAAGIRRIFLAQLAESLKKKTKNKNKIIDIVIIPGAWERAWWILASLAPAARESRATEAVGIRACALASVRARSGRSMRAHWRGSRPPFARVCLCSRDPPSRQPRRRRPATV